MKIPTIADRAFVQALAERLIAEAERLGVTVTIERRPLTPLAMGHHEPVIVVWQHRKDTTS